MCEGKLKSRDFQGNSHDSFLIKTMFNGTLVVMIIMMITATIGMVVDGMVIGKFLGTNSMAAYGLASPVLLFLLAFGGVFSAGCQTCCTNLLGKGRNREARSCLSVTFWSGLVISVIFLLLLLFGAGPIAKALGASSDILDESVDYLRAFGIGIPALIITTILQPIIQIEGKRKMVILSVLLMTLTNCAGDLLNALVLKGGMFGMGMATSVGYYVAMLFLLTNYVSPKAFLRPTVWQLKLSYLKNVFISGFPTALGSLSVTVKTYLVNLIIMAQAGNIGVAAVSVQASMDIFLGCVVPGTGRSVLMVTSVLYGEENRTGLKDLFKQAIKMVLILSCSVAVIIFIFAGAFATLFLKDASAKDLAVLCLRVYAFSLPLYGINACFQNFFQGSGKLGMANMICLLERMGFISASAFVLSRFLGTMGVFLGMPVGEFFMLLTVIVVRMIKNKKFKLSPDELLGINPDFGGDISDTYECTVREAEELKPTVSDVETFCRKHEKNEHDTKLCELIVEEMAGNIIKHGFLEKESRVDIRIIMTGDDMIVRLRDNCRKFDPVSYWKNVNREDISQNIGLRLAMNSAKDIAYSYTIKMNNLIVRI